MLCLQETKASKAQLGLLADVAGYHCYWHGDKGYSGVALLVSERVAPDCPSYLVPPFDFETRIVTVRERTTLSTPMRDLPSDRG